MRNKEEVQALLVQIQEVSQANIEFDEAKIFAEYQRGNGSSSNLAIKVLSIFGGFMATVTFLGFLFLGGLYNSEMGQCIMGAVFIVCSVILNKQYDSLTLGTVSIAAYVIGYFLLSIGLSGFYFDENSISVFFILIALLTMLITQNYLLAFIALLIINACLLVLLITEGNYDLLHIYVALLAFVLTFVILAESKIISISKAFAKIYAPLRIALIFIFLGNLALLGKRYIFPMEQVQMNLPIWMPSLLMMAAIIYTLAKILTILQVKKIEQQAGVYLVVALFLIPTLYSPAISGAALVMLLSFMVNHKTGLVLGLIALFYYIGQYYYDLNFTLLTKSIIMMVSGLLMLLIYFFTHKQLSHHEKI